MEESEIVAALTKARQDREMPVTELKMGENAHEDNSYIELYSFLGADDSDKANDKYNNKLKEVYEFAKEKDQDKAELLWKIRSIEQKLSEPPIGMSRIDHLYNYVKAQKAAESAMKEAEVYLR